MTKLPFVVQPRFPHVVEVLGNEESGRIEIVRKGYLSTGERALSEGADNNAQIGQLVYGLSRRAATKFNVSLDEGQEIVTRLMTADVKNKKEEAFLEEVGSELSSLLDLMTEGSKKKRIIYAYVLLRYRVNDQIEIEDVMELHPDLTDALADLFEDEEKKSVARLQEAFENDSSDTAEKLSKAAEKK